MVTVTLRHREGMALKELVRGLCAAWRRTRQGGKVQDVWTGRVSASVRALEVTHGQNGWHPHVHVLLRTTEWSDPERAALQARWEASIVRELGPAARPDDLHGLVWSEPFEGTPGDERPLYLTKMGLEVSGVAKHAARGSRTPWDIARAAADGDSRALWLWREFYASTKGRRAVELDDRAAAAAKRAEELEGADKDAGEGSSTSEMQVKRDDVRALRMLEPRMPGIFAMVLRAAEQEGFDGARQWIAYARAHASLRGQGRTAPRPGERGVEERCTAPPA